MAFSFCRAAVGRAARALGGGIPSIRVRFWPTELKAFGRRWTTGPTLRFGDGELCDIPLGCRRAAFQHAKAIPSGMHQEQGPADLHRDTVGAEGRVGIGGPCSEGVGWVLPQVSDTVAKGCPIKSGHLSLN